MAVFYRPDFRGIALLARTPQMSAAMLDRAGDIRDVAESIAPVGAGEGGHYKDQITADAAVIAGLAAARVNARKFTSGFIEFGTSDTPAFAPLRNACDGAGVSLAMGSQASA